MDFIKKHYEKVILSLVLLGVVGALVALPFVIAKDKADMEAMADIVTPKPKDLPPLDLSAENNILARMQTSYALDLSTTNKLFNPVTWKKNEAGDLLKITSGHEIDAEAAVVTNITPLYFILSLETVETNVGFRYVIGVQRQGSRTHATQHQTRVASVGEKEDFFTIMQAYCYFGYAVCAGMAARSFNINNSVHGGKYTIIVLIFLAGNYSGMNKFIAGPLTVFFLSGMKIY